VTKVKIYRRKNGSKAFVLSCVLCLVSCLCFSQERTRILFLIDASLSMKNEWRGGSKWDVAKIALSNIADSVALVPNCEMGMRVFGHMYPEPDKNCHDSHLEVRIDSNNSKSIKKKLSEIRPKGITPLVYSIEKSVGDFGNVSGKNILIIITDGEDACNRDPCSVTQLLQKNNILLRPFIIGMSLQAKSFEEMQCMGKLYNTNTAEEFFETVKNVVSESIAKTSLQVNLNDINGKPTESDVNMTFYDVETGMPKYQMYHSMNPRGLPDTIVVSPMFKYRLQVHTIPPLFVEDIALKNKLSQYHTG
jgi:Ca-activated chloride channel family protein